MLPEKNSCFMASNYKGNHFNKSLAIRICLNAELLKKAGFCANIITGLNRDNYLSLDTIEKVYKTLACGNIRIY